MTDDSVRVRAEPTLLHERLPPPARAKLDECFTGSIDAKLRDLGICQERPQCAQREIECGTLTGMIVPILSRLNELVLWA